MDIMVGDKVTLKKPHPCGCNVFLVTRVGMDFKLRCTKCDHEIMTPRAKIQKFIKHIDVSERKTD